MSEPDPFKINEAVIDLWRCYTIERDMAKELEAENARLKAEVERLKSLCDKLGMGGKHTITAITEENALLKAEVVGHLQKMMYA